MRRLLYVFVVLLMPCFAAGQDTLKLLSWNIQMLPDGFRWFSSSLRKLQHVRQPWIAEYANQEDYDVIVFQEVFDRTMRRRLRRALRKKYPYHVDTKIKAGFIFTNGILIVSRLPMKYLGHTIYRKGIFEDRLAAKGCTLVEVEKNGKKIHIAGTHMQAGNTPECEKIREAQYVDIRKLFDKHSKPNMPEILAGDLNTRRDAEPIFSKMLAALNMENFDIDDPEPYTIDGRNSWNSHDKPIQLDYILLQPNESKTQLYQQKIIRPQREYKGKMVDYADHYGIGGWIVF
jgi:sphingomyelin phosphodiesterase